MLHSSAGRCEVATCHALCSNLQAMAHAHHANAHAHTQTHTDADADGFGDADVEQLHQQAAGMWKEVQMYLHVYNA